MRGEADVSRVLVGGECDSLCWCVCGSDEYLVVLRIDEVVINAPMMDDIIDDDYDATSKSAKGKKGKGKNNKAYVCVVWPSWVRFSEVVVCSNRTALVRRLVVCLCVCVP